MGYAGSYSYSIESAHINPDYNKYGSWSASKMGAMSVEILILEQKYIMK